MTRPLVAAPLLESTQGRVALKSTQVRAGLHDALARVTLVQVYANEEQQPIEAVYTFPLPLGATLLDLSVRLGERELTAAAMEKTQAEETYEEAVTDGDAAFLLQEVEPGLYTMNVGNLNPGEEAQISLSYAQPHRFQGKQLRFHLPTTLAPRYGDPGKAGLAPHQTPETVLDSGLAFSLHMTVAGFLAQAEITSPTHQLSTIREADRTMVRLAGETASMDRDLVLLLEPHELPQAVALAATDEQAGETAQAVLATFLPRLPRDHATEPVNVKIVVDCSGSMQGDSIAQAREALARILDALDPEDHFSVVAFGSTHRRLFLEQAAVGPTSLEVARSFVAELAADMGGTELGKALDAAYKLPSRCATPPTVLLITDGEVFDTKGVIKAAKGSGHRVFTVGVGASVSEPLVRGLAEATGGACELVTPNEAMADKILRHFQRIHLPAAKDVAITWPGQPLDQCPAKLDAVFTGDTVAVFARFAAPVDGAATLRADFGNGLVLEQSAEISTPAPELWEKLDAAPDTLARLAAHGRIRQSTTDKEALAMALDYNLLSPHTHLILVDVRAEGEKSDGIPALRKVPHTLAAGWGGMGSVKARSARHMRAPMPVSVRMDAKAASLVAMGGRAPVYGPGGVFPDEPIAPPPGMPRGLEIMLRALSARFADDVAHQDPHLLFRDLDMAGAPEDLLQRLLSLVRQGGHEAIIVLLVLRLLHGQDVYKPLFSRSLARLVTKKYKELSPLPDLEAKVAQALRA